MHGLQFLDVGTDLSLALSSNYRPGLVVLSVAIASLASYAALGLASRIREAETGSTRRSWLLSGAIAMGIGVWAMHFVGMLAFRLPVPVAYDVFTTLVSMIPAALASAAAIRVIAREKVTRTQILIGGVLMGLGIAAMHFIGMAAMRLAARMLYDPLLFAGSLFVGVALTTGALAVSVGGVGRGRLGEASWLAASVLMGLAVSGLHYTAMYAVVFFPAAQPTGSRFHIDPETLALLVALAAVVLLGLTIVVVVVDRRLKEAAHVARATRKRMVEAIESISEGFSLFDPQDRLVMCNSKYRDLLSGGDDLRPGQSFEEILSKAGEAGAFAYSAEERDAWMNRRLAQHAEPLDAFVQAYSDGRWVQINERKTNDGFTVAVYTDITDLKRTQLQLSSTLEKLRSAQAHLVHSEKMTMLGQLTAGIAHEINNPLGVISSLADSTVRCVDVISAVCDSASSVEEAKASTRLQRALRALSENGRTIMSGADRIGKIVDSLRNFARLDEASLKLTDVHESVETTLNLMQFQVHGRIRINKTFGDLPRIYCNPADLNQAFLALLTKAAERIRGPGSISIETSRDASHVYVCVRDSGQGMSDEALAGLFEIRFANDGERVGVDMGLSSAYHVIRSHEGELEVTSEPDKGTQFRVKLPIQPSDIGVAGTRIPQ